MIKSSHRFNFGKYRGQFVDAVAAREPGYIYFCENRLGHRFSPKVKRIARNASNRNRYDRDMMEEGIFSGRFSRPDFY